MTLDERLEALPIDDEVAAMRLARAWLAEAGDLPQNVAQTLAQAQRAPGDFMAALEGVRDRHFAALGRKAPAWRADLE